MVVFPENMDIESIPVRQGTVGGGWGETDQQGETFTFHWRFERSRGEATPCGGFCE